MRHKTKSATLSRMVGLSLFAHVVVIAAVVGASLDSSPSLPAQDLSTLNVIMIDPNAYASHANSLDKAPSDAEAQPVSPPPPVASLPEPVPEKQPPTPVKPEPKVKPPIVEKKLIKPKPKAKPLPEKKGLHQKVEPVTKKALVEPLLPIKSSSSEVAHHDAHSKASLSSSVSSNTTVKSASGKSGASSGQHQGTAKPISRHQPMYPRQAQRMNIEGEITVKYDVNASGHVENIRVIKAKFANYFEREVIKAMQRWRYEKKATKNLQVTIVFKLAGGAKIQD